MLGDYSRKNPHLPDRRLSENSLGRRGGSKALEIQAEEVFNPKKSFCIYQGVGAGGSGFFFGTTQYQIPGTFIGELAKYTTQYYYYYYYYKSASNVSYLHHHSCNT